ncbi:MAG: hypothetical protein HYV27_19155 [Candidatus Hydrogenedentes bacterium]|nr:hypothetical protein [Candidatus Hydrogenedentota bacterium]
MVLQELTTRSFHVPLRGPLQMARGKTLHAREGMLLTGSTADGIVAVAEASPLPGFSRETLASLDTALDEFCAACLPFEIDPDERCFSLWTRLPDLPDSLRFALAMLLSQIQAQARGVALHEALAPGSAGVIRCNALLSGTRAGCMEKAAACREAGFRRVKLKVLPESPEVNGAFVNEVAEALGDGVKIRVDVNQQWELAQALHFAEVAWPACLDYLEEPVRTPADLSACEAAGLPYALDESWRAWTADGAALTDGALKPLLAGAKAWIWKPTLHFDRTMLRTLENRMRAGAGPQIVLSSAYESGVGIALLSHLAAAFSNGAAAGLDTYASLDADVRAQRLEPLQPEMTVYPLATPNDLGPA